MAGEVQVANVTIGEGVPDGVTQGSFNVLVRLEIREGRLVRIFPVAPVRLELVAGAHGSTLELRYDVRPPAEVVSTRSSDTWPRPDMEGRTLADLADSPSTLDPEEQFELEIERHLSEVRGNG